MGIEGIIPGGLGGGKPVGSKEFPIKINIGESEAAIPCSACKRMHQAGVFVIAADKAILICMRCTGAAVVRYQEMHPTEKLFDVDIDVGDDHYKEAADAVRATAPQLSESKAMDVAKAVIKAIG